MSRPLLAAVLAALVLTSGCSFLGGGGATPTSDGVDGATPTVTPTATPTATATPTPTPAGPAYPDGYAQEGVTNATAAISAHTDSLVSHRSFIVTINGTVLAGNRTAQVRQLQSVDNRRDRALIAVNDTEGTERTTYFGNGTRYLQVVPREGNTTYNVTDATLDPRAFTGAAFVAPVLTNVTYDTANVTRNENGTFFSYRAATVDRSAFPVLLGPSVNASNVTGFDATIVVDEEGIVRRMSYQAVIERGDESLVVDVRLETFGIDRVNVSPPPWLEEAREADSS